jgi:hypothetical protein
VTITGDGEATLLFSQSPADAPWTTAIKIHCGHTTLNGFAVRFEGPIRWDQEVSYGPAVIGTTDNRDQGKNDLKVDIVMTRLDLQIPAPADPSRWVEALRLIRLTNAQSGTISGNILVGGPIEFFGGPWQFINNDFRGTPAGTFSHGVYTGHGTHDLVIKGNRAKPMGPSGKTWRFLVLTHHGSGDRVEDNVIEDLGAREGDTIPWMNEPEIILTEAYHLNYEGRLAALSSDGRLLRIDAPQGQPAATGDVVSLLSGPSAGQYRRICQAIDPVTYLVDQPVPKGTDVVSISRGFVDETFQGNRIDTRLGTMSDNLVLPGNHFGTRVVKNHFLGGGHSVRLSSYPSESPVCWGWSHVPFLGGVIEENIFEDSQKGGLIGVEHSARDIKSNKGRTYMTIALSNNIVRWSEPFLNRTFSSGARSSPVGLTLGYLPSHDLGEFVVNLSGNRLEAPAGVNSTKARMIEHVSGKFISPMQRKPSQTGRLTDAVVPPSAGSGAARPRR